MGTRGADDRVRHALCEQPARVWVAAAAADDIAVDDSRPRSSAGFLAKQRDELRRGRGVAAIRARLFASASTASVRSGAGRARRERGVVRVGRRSQRGA